MSQGDLILFSVFIPVIGDIGPILKRIKTKRRNESGGLILFIAFIPVVGWIGPILKRKSEAV